MSPPACYILFTLNLMADDAMTDLDAVSLIQGTCIDNPEHGVVIVVAECYDNIVNLSQTYVIDWRLVPDLHLGFAGDIVYMQTVGSPISYDLPFAAHLETSYRIVDYHALFNH